MYEFSFRFAFLKAFLNSYQRATRIAREAVQLDQYNKHSSTCSVSKTSQSLRLMTARDESKSSAELGSMASKLCSQMNAVLSTFSGLVAVGRFSHCLQRFRNWAGIKTQGTLSREVVFLVTILSCIRLSLACWTVSDSRRTEEPLTFSFSARLRSSRLFSFEMWIRASHTEQSSASVDSGFQDGYKVCNRRVA